MKVLLMFANAKDLKGSKYITNSMHISILMKIFKTIIINLLYNQDFDEDEDNVFEINDAKKEDIQNNKINELINTFGLLNKVKSKLYKNIKKYYLILITKNLILSIFNFK